jgi:hypothetical protein
MKKRQPMATLAVTSLSSPGKTSTRLPRCVPMPGCNRVVSRRFLRKQWLLLLPQTSRKQEGTKIN